MSDPALGLLMLGLIVVVIMMGFPTAFTLMGLGMFFGFIAFYDPTHLFTDNKVFELMVQRTYGAMTNDVLISIPLFVLMGYVMERGALVDKMFYSIQLAFRNVPASLAVATLIVCTFWGIASGLVGAVVVLMGVIAFNPMLRAGYDVKLASGVITAGGTLGILIPPSIVMVIYSVATGGSVALDPEGKRVLSASVGQLFMAGVIPGLMLASMLGATTFYRAWKNDYPRMPRATWGQCFKAFRESIWGLLLIVIVLGGIYTGAFTPTEAAAVSAVYAFVIAVFVYKDMTLKDVPRVLLGSANMSAMILYIVTNAVLFSFLMTSEQIPQRMISWVAQSGFTWIEFLLFVNILLLIAGNVMEPSSIVLITAPILFPVAVSLGINPVHLGILMTVNMEVGLCHPPVGLNLYVASGIARMGITELTIAVWPWLLTMLIFLVIVTYIPELSLWLPRMLGML